MTGAVAGLIVGLIGAGVSAYGTYQQGQAQQKEAEYSARVATRNALHDKYTSEYNQAAAQANKREALKAADIKREQLVKEGKAKAGSLAAKLAARGLSVSADTSSALLLSEMADADEKASMALYQGATQGIGLQRKSQVFGDQGENALSVGQMQATSYRMAGASAARSGTIGAIGTGLQGTSSSMLGYAKTTG